MIYLHLLSLIHLQTHMLLPLYLLNHFVLCPLVNMTNSNPYYSPLSTQLILFLIIALIQTAGFISFYNPCINDQFNIILQSSSKQLALFKYYSSHPNNQFYLNFISPVQMGSCILFLTIALAHVTNLIIFQIHISHSHIFHQIHIRLTLANLSSHSHSSYFIHTHKPLIVFTSVMKQKHFFK